MRGTPEENGDLVTAFLVAPTAGSAPTRGRRAASKREKNRAFILPPPALAAEASSASRKARSDSVVLEGYRGSFDNYSCEDPATPLLSLCCPSMSVLAGQRRASGTQPLGRADARRFVQNGLFPGEAFDDLGPPGEQEHRRL